MDARDPCPTVANPVAFADVFDGRQPPWETAGGQWHIGPTNLYESAVIDPDGAYAWPPASGAGGGDVVIDAPMRATDQGEGTASFGLLARFMPPGTDPAPPTYSCRFEGDLDAARVVLRRESRGGLGKVLAEAPAPAGILQGAFYPFRLAAQGGRLRCAIGEPPVVAAADDPSPLPTGTVGIVFTNARGETESVTVRTLAPPCSLP